MSRYDSTAKTSKEMAVAKADRRRTALVLVFLAVVTAVAVGFILRYIGQALNHTAYDYECEISVHEHSDDCYKVDNQGQFVLNKDGEKILVCGIADYPAHKHNRYCYNAKTGELTCPLEEHPEHVHVAECYRTDRVLVCTNEELTVDEADVMNKAVEDGKDPYQALEDFRNGVTPSEPTKTPETTEAPTAEPTEAVADPVEPGAEEQAKAPAEPTEAVADPVEVPTEPTPEVVANDVDTTMASLISTAPAQFVEHKHDSSCYEYKKVLICGELETQVVHDHSDACAVERELTDKEKAKLDRAPLDPEKEYTLTYEDDDYVVTATYMGTAGIPQDAEMVVKEVESQINDDNHDELAQEMLDLTGDNKQEASEVEFKSIVALDICFIVDEEEFEPADKVDIKIKFKKEELAKKVEEAKDLTLIHSSDEKTEVVDIIDSNKGASDEVGFSADSFSVYEIVTSYKEVEEIKASMFGDDLVYKVRANTAGQTKYVHLNTVDNAFVNTTLYDQYKKDIDGNYYTGALGKYCSYFAITAFDTVNARGHQNLNVLANKANMDIGDWGDKQWTAGSMSYIREIGTSISSKPEAGGSTHAVGLGAGNKLYVANDTLYIGNSNSTIANYKTTSTALEMASTSADHYYIEATVGEGENQKVARIVDLDAAYAEVAAINTNWKNTPTTTSNATAYVMARGAKNNVEFTRNIIEEPLKDGENLYEYKSAGVDVSGLGGSAVVHLDYTDLQHKDFFDIKFKDYNSTDNKQTVGLVINIDCKGQSNIDFSNISNVRILDKNNVLLATNGEQDKKQSRIIWNFYNYKTATASDPTRAHIKFTGNTFGVIIAQDADLSIAHHNGQAVAQVVNLTDENHRWDYYGIEIPFNVEFQGRKTVDGGQPQNSYTFAMESWSGSGWTNKKTVTSNSTTGTIIFPSVSFVYNETTNSDGNYYYRIYEENNSKAGYDKSVYVIQVVVSGSNAAKNVYKYQTFNNDDGIVETQNGFTYGGKAPGTDATSTSAGALDFDNTSGGKFHVQKKWLNEYGTEINSTNSTEYSKLPESITVNLYRYIGDYQVNPTNGTLVSGSEKTLTKANGYKASWTGLDIQDADGNVYHYYAVENPVEGYELVPLEIGSVDIGKTEGNPLVLTNRKKPETTNLRIDKSFLMSKNNDTDSNDWNNYIILNKQTLSGTVEIAVYRRYTFDIENANVNMEHGVDYYDPYKDGHGGSLTDSWSAWEECVAEHTYKIGGELEGGPRPGITEGKLSKASNVIPFTISGTADYWWMEITNLPKMGMVNNKPVLYQYTARELSCDIDGFKYKAKITPSTSENGTISSEAEVGKIPMMLRHVCETGQKIQLYNKNFETAEAELVKKWTLFDGTTDDDNLNYSAPEDIEIEVQLVQLENPGDTSGAAVADYKLHLVKQDNTFVTDITKVNETIAGLEVTSEGQWHIKVSNLPKKYITTDGNGKSVIKEYSYQFKETSLPGGYEMVSSTTGDDGITTTIVNKSTQSFELPETGGKGTLTHRIRLWFRGLFN